MALDGLLKAVDALHAGRKAVVMSGEGPYSQCGMEMEVEVERFDFMAEGGRLDKGNVARKGLKCRVGWGARSAGEY